MPDSILVARHAEFLMEHTIWWMGRADKNQIIVQNFNYGKMVQGACKWGYDQVNKVDLASLRKTLTPEQRSEGYAFTKAIKGEN